MHVSNPEYFDRETAGLGQSQFVNHGIDRRSPAMMKGAERSIGMHGSDRNGATSPTIVHHQDLSGVIAANSYFRYDDSVNQQKARNTGYHQNQTHHAQQHSTKGAGPANIGNLNFENSMRQSEIQSNLGASEYGENMKGAD